MNKKQRLCREKAPESLTGSLTPLYCSRELDRHGNHAGEHKAHKTVQKVGRITVLWRQADQAGRPSVYRPEVVLPSKTSPELEHTRIPVSAGKAYQVTYGAKTPRCECPAHWAHTNLHYPGCRMARL
jgi:hypothetical protein